MPKYVAEAIVLKRVPIEIEAETRELAWQIHHTQHRDIEMAFPGFEVPESFMFTEAEYRKEYSYENDEPIEYLEL